MKMLLTLAFALTLTSLTSFAATYDGQGNETEYGVETCQMDVTNTGMKTIVVMRALNEEVSAVVSDDTEVDFTLNTTSKGKSKSSLTIKASGKIKDNKPVSYSLEITSNDPMMGKDKQSINCKF